MPVFEEKMVSPLAIRFTQNHIRTTFRDGRVVEPTVEEIEVRPAPVGSEYDVVLHAPFPHVEIVRWRVNGEDGADKSSSHWFTLDNRRLYCLQRAAVALWPQRVAAVVEILYTDMGRMRRKFDSTTCGWAVSISHSLKQEELSRWDWRLNVPGLRARCLDSLVARAKTGSAEYVVLDTILDDDEKQTTEELASAPEQKGMLASFFGEADAAALPPLLAEPAEDFHRFCSTGSSSSSDVKVVAMASTAPPSSSASTCAASQADSDFDEGEAAARAAAGMSAPASAAVKRALDNSHWHGSQGEVYKLQPRGEATWAVVRTDASKMAASKRFTIAYDKDSACLWWGIRGMYYADVSSLSTATPTPERIAWKGWDARQKQYRPRFTWRRMAINARP